MLLNICSDGSWLYLTFSCPWRTNLPVNNYPQVRLVQIYSPRFYLPIGTKYSKVIKWENLPNSTPTPTHATGMFVCLWPCSTIQCHISTDTPTDHTSAASAASAASSSTVYERNRVSGSREYGLKCNFCYGCMCAPFIKVEHMHIWTATAGQKEKKQTAKLGDYEIQLHRISR